MCTELVEYSFDLVLCIVWQNRFEFKISPNPVWHIMFCFAQKRRRLLACIFFLLIQAIIHFLKGMYRYSKLGPSILCIFKVYSKRLIVVRNRLGSTKQLNEHKNEY